MKVQRTAHEKRVLRKYSARKVLETASQIASVHRVSTREILLRALTAYWKRTFDSYEQRDMVSLVIDLFTNGQAPAWKNLTDLQLADEFRKEALLWDDDSPTDLPFSCTTLNGVFDVYLSEDE